MRARSLDTLQLLGHMAHAASGTLTEPLLRRLDFRGSDDTILRHLPRTWFPDREYDFGRHCEPAPRARDNLHVPEHAVCRSRPPR